MSAATSTQVRGGAVRKPRHAPAPQRRSLSLVPQPARKSAKWRRPLVLGSAALAFSVAIVVLGYGVLVQGQANLQRLQAEVAAENLIHDKALLKVETMQSPLRVTDAAVAADRLVAPIYVREVPEVGLSLPVRPIQYVPELRYIPPTPTPPPVATSKAPGTTSASAPAAKTDGSSPATTNTVPGVTTPANPSAQPKPTQTSVTFPGALPPITSTSGTR